MGNNLPIGERLKEERERLGLSQSALGEAVGVGRKSQFNYESGRTTPDAEYLALAASLGVDVRYVITGSRDYEPPPALSSDEALLLKHYRAAVPAVRKAAQGALLGGAAPGVVVHGTVGQHIHGSASIRGQTINVGVGKKRGQK